MLNQNMLSASRPKCSVFVFLVVFEAKGPLRKWILLSLIAIKTGVVIQLFLRLLERLQGLVRIQPPNTMVL